MTHEKSAAHQEKTEQESRSSEIRSKLSVTQNVIRNKFEKACKNRLEHEHDAKQAMEPFTQNQPLEIKTGDLQFKDNEYSIHDLSNTTTKNSTLQLCLPPKKKYEKHCNSNELCDDLRILLSSLINGNGNCMQEINRIIEELHEQEIII